MNKIHKRKAALVFASFMLIIMIIFSMIMLSSFENTYAETTSSDALLTKLKQMTEDLEIKVNNQTVDITNYSSYLNSRFQLENKHYDVRDIADEWILEIIPIELFKLKQEYFYIGSKYGFYVNYNNSSNNYLVYLIRNKLDYSNGLFYRSIEPLYYEQYVYNEETETVSLVYMDYYIYPDPEHYPTLKLHYYHYRKHSDYEKFTGSLYNANHPNIDEVGYDKYKDNGGSASVFNDTSAKAQEIGVVTPL